MCGLERGVERDVWEIYGRVKYKLDCVLEIEEQQRRLYGRDKGEVSRESYVGEIVERGLESVMWEKLERREGCVGEIGE